MDRRPEKPLNGLRIVASDDAAAETDTTLDPAISATVAKILADQPIVLLMVWEKPDGSVGVAALPKSLAVAKGLVLAAYEMLFPDENDNT
jgi:hypothetical protein